MRQFFLAFRYLLIIVMMARVDAASAQSGQPAALPLQSSLIASWIVTVSDEPRQRNLIIRDLVTGSNGTFLLDATYGWLDAKLTQVRGEIIQLNQERRLELVTPADSKIVARQLTDGSFTGTLTSRNGIAKTVKLERLDSVAIIKNTPTIASNMAAPIINPANFELNIVRHEGGEFDGVWSGVGTVKTGSNCANTSIKFAVNKGRIFIDGLSHGAYFGSGSSKLYGVIHRDKTVDLTLVDRNGKGRSSQVYGIVDAQSNMVLTDLGNNCSFEYKLTKG